VRTGTTRFEELGGDAGVKTAVAIFYNRVLADPELAPFFDGVDVGRLRMHQRAFLTAALGGPELFTGRGLEQAHAGRGIDDAAFDRLLDHLAETLGDLGLSAGSVAVVREHVEELRTRIVV
jgi:hemoglobin